MGTDPLSLSTARELELYAEQAPDSVLGVLGYTYAMSGRRKEAEWILAKLGKDSRNRMWDIALVEIGLGRKDEALAWLERDYQAHDDDDLLWLKVDPMYDSLRYEPRFQALLKGMNFPP